LNKVILKQYVLNNSSMSETSLISKLDKFDKEKDDLEIITKK